MLNIFGLVLLYEVKDENTGKLKRKSYDVQFTSEDSLGEGIVSHELGHQLGQGIEFFHLKQKYDDDKPIGRAYCNAFH